MPRRKKNILDKIQKLADLEAIQALIKEMTPLLHLAGVKNTNSIFEVKSDRHSEVRFFLMELYIREYTEYKKAYNTVPPKVWENYKLSAMIGRDPFPEEIHLQEKAKELIKVWKNRPKKSKKEND